MADEPQQNEQQQEVKTVQDVRMDQLTARLDALESENRKLREANASLYAMSNPVREDPVREDPVREEPEHVVQVSQPEEDGALRSFNQSMYGGM